ncbi:hypothetical protein QVD17_02981 [Tagetes erecta]|uniref:Uncharacterized protein n=1 Tax=Tagetes erecta TaxID=13708 RepID=A0AAD8P889_TARER|nr:hypothetical protein QVD17_02981 [Tagetes erecta]
MQSDKHIFYSINSETERIALHNISCTLFPARKIYTTSKLSIPFVHPLLQQLVSVRLFSLLFPSTVLP